MSMSLFIVTNDLNQELVLRLIEVINKFNTENGLGQPYHVDVASRHQTCCVNCQLTFTNACLLKTFNQ